MIYVISELRVESGLGLSFGCHFSYFDQKLAAEYFTSSASGDYYEAIKKDAHSLPVRGVNDLNRFIKVSCELEQLTTA